MKKAVMLSIRPKWCEKIARGEKTIEVRKNRPEMKTPFKCYIYCTYGKGLIERNDPCYPNMLLDQTVSRDKTWGNCCNGKVIGEFVCKDFVTYCNGKPVLTIRKETAVEIEKRSCLSREEILEYAPKGNPIGWCISDLVIYEKPKELSEFKLYYCSVVREGGYPMPTHEMRRPPQSWCYVREV